jgi:hypothetical protein
MTKYYVRHFANHVGNGKRMNGFAMGLADFACLGFQRYDLAGYPYEDENEALFSDWVRLGQDIEEAKKDFEASVAK